MEPVEINAGAWYLRSLRDDDRVSDRPALTALGRADLGYVARAHQDWADETRFTWAVCEPTTGEMLAEIAVTAEGTIEGHARDGHQQALADSLPVVRRFAEGPLGIELTN